MKNITRIIQLSAGLAGFLSVLTLPATLWAGPDGDTENLQPNCCTASKQAELCSIPKTQTIIERQANVFTASTQENATLAIDPAGSGNVVIVWDSRRQEAGTYGVFARLFDAQGNPLSPEIHVNDYVRGIQRRPAVSFDNQGGIWFAWQTTGQDGSATGIAARRFTNDFASATKEIAVNTIRDGSQVEPILATNQAGQTLIIWETPNNHPAAAPGSQELHTRLFAADGQPLTAEQTLNANASANHDHTASIIYREVQDEFLAVFTRTTPENGSSAIYAQRLNANAEPLEEAFRISPIDATQDHLEPSVATDAEGRFTVSWMTSAPDQDGYSVSLRRFAADATTLDENIITVAPANANWKSATAVAMNPQGRIAVAYNAFAADGEYEGIYLRKYDSQGQPESTAPIQINQTTSGRQYLTPASGVNRLAWNPATEDFVIAWNGKTTAGDSSGANLSILTNESQAIENASPVTLLETKFAAAENILSSLQYLKPTPPIWDPNWEPQEPLINPQGDGPDFGFEAVQATGWTPPDPEMAVGPDSIVVMTNGEISAYNKDGTQLWQDEIENSFGFWGALGADNFVFDPEVLWDPQSERFFAMAVERSDDRRSNFLLAVSKDNRPDTNNDWWKWRLDVTAISDNDIDSPNMAVDAGHLYLTADFFGPDKFLVYVLEKAPLLSGGAINANHELIVGAGQQSMGIPVTYDADAPAQYIIQSTEFSNNTKVILHAIRDPLNNYSRVTFDLPVQAYQFPNQPPQKGTTSRPFLFEPRFWSCVYRNGSLWAVHHVNSSRVRARWYEIAMNGWPESGRNPSVAQWGEIDPGPGIHTFFASIAVDNLGNAAITFARSSTEEFISMSRAIRAFDDPAGEFQPVEFVKESNGTTTSGRWGDYSFTQSDPTADGVFWGHHEFVVSNNNWRTWVARYLMDNENRLNLLADPLVAGTPVTLTVDNGIRGELAFFAYSLTGLGDTPIPQLNITLEILQPKLAGKKNFDLNGIAQITRSIPLNMSGRTVWLQAAILGRRSNVIEAKVQ